MSDDKSKIESFTFDPIESRSQDRLLDYVQSDWNGEYYEMPINLNDLYNLSHSSVFHSSPLDLKAKVLLSTLKPTKFISNRDFLHAAKNFLTFGNTFIERVDSATSKLICLKNSPAMRTRRAKGDNYLFLNSHGNQHHKFKEGSVFHLIEPDIKQEIYGLPSYLASVISSRLNKESTLFRLKYYLNGSHAGYIIHLTDPGYSEDDLTALKTQLKSSRGDNSFKNLFLHSPDGKPDGLKLIPISEVTAKDEFKCVKEASREDELGMHRVPPQIMGIVPKNSGGFSDPNAAAKVFARNEIMPLQTQFLEINDWLGQEVISFNDYSIDGIEDDKQSKKK